MSVVIGRPINGISLNGLEYLLDKDNKAKKFKNKEEAISFLKQKGYSNFTDEEFEDNFVFEETLIRILFLDDYNGHASKDPHAFLVDIEEQGFEITPEFIREHEVWDRFAGGKIKETLTKIGFRCTIVSQGVRSEYDKIDYDFEFKLTSGNY